MHHFSAESDASSAASEELVLVLQQDRKLLGGAWASRLTLPRFLSTQVYLLGQQKRSVLISQKSAK